MFKIGYKKYMPAYKLQKAGLAYIFCCKDLCCIILQKDLYGRNTTKNLIGKRCYKIICRETLHQLFFTVVGVFSPTTI
jgi:hypothetical protein